MAHKKRQYVTSTLDCFMSFHMIVSHFRPIRLLVSRSLCMMGVLHESTSAMRESASFQHLVTFAARYRTLRDRIRDSLRCLDKGEDVSAIARTVVRGGPDISCDSTERKFDWYVHNQKFEEVCKR